MWTVLHGREEIHRKEGAMFSKDQFLITIQRYTIDCHSTPRRRMASDSASLAGHISDKSERARGKGTVDRCSKRPKYNLESWRE
jgi:hypothetical protein